MQRPSESQPHTHGEKPYHREPRLAVALILAGICPPLAAQTCTVPGSHATIREAVDDPACVTVNLAAQTYPESIVLRRSLTLAGPGSGGVVVVQGLVLMTGSGTQVTLNDL